jgi:hypothetical protein
MDSQEINNLYKILKKGYNNSDWDMIQEAIDYISEYLDDDEENVDDI